MVTQGIVFEKLTLIDALDLASLIEEEARDRYEELAQHMKVHGARGAEAFFRKMARAEEMHHSVLIERRQRLFGTARAHVMRTQVLDVEAPGWDEARTEMTPQEAMEVAMRSEVKAYEFFNAAVAKVHDADVKALFIELRAEELEHQGRVRAELARFAAFKHDASTR